MSSIGQKDARDFYETKQKAVKYYLENGVPQKMEEILNSMFYDDPEDVYGHLANYFDQFTKPAVITKLAAQQALDGRGQPTIQTQVYCKIKNKEKMASSSVSPSPNTHLLDNAKLEDRETYDQKRAESVKAAMNYINTEISSKIKDMKPVEQSQIDALLTLYMQMLREEEIAHKSEEAEATAAEEVKPVVPSPTTKDGKEAKKGKGSAGKGAGKGGKGSVAPIIPEEPREEFVQGAELVCAVSQAVCAAGASTRGVPLYEHISSLYHAESCQLRMPLPMVTIMQSGRAALGKLNCVKEFMVIPSPGLSYTQSLDYITGIYNYVEKSLSSKGGVGLKAVNELGALLPVFERPEQGLDLLQEAITAANLTPGEDIHIALNAAGHEMFDFEKGKYEVATGQLKTTDDLVDYWVELMSRYPSILVIIDPMRKQDREQWMRLCDRITDRCFVAGERIYNRPGLLRYEELPETRMTGATVLAMENLTSVSDIFACAKMMEGAGNQIILTARAGETQDDFLADLAVGMNIRFLKLGAPNRSERVSKFNRLLQIEAELQASGRLAPQVDHEFVHIALPQPEGEDEAAPPASPASTSTKESKKEGKKK